MLPSLTSRRWQVERGDCLDWPLSIIPLPLEDMARRRRTILIRIMIFLFFLNFLSLAVYFFIHSPAAPSPQKLTPSLTAPSLKPWPSLPSFLPWNPSPKPPPRSCEAYFGNGFSRRIDAHGGGPGSSGGWFRCHYSATLRSSICEGGRVRMNPSQIKMSVGGESLDSVMGRREEEELPKFDGGAFEIEGHGSEARSIKDRRVVDEEFLDSYAPRGAIQFHTMRGLMESMRIIGPDELQCSQWIEEPTVLVTRFEYANLFHTVTDWYSAYVSSRVIGLFNRPHLIFVDGHCKAPLEETWNALFTSVRYAKHFTGSVCFRHVILSPLGYETAMFKGLSESFNCHGTSATNQRSNPEHQKTARLAEFGEMLRAAFEIPADENWIKKPSTVHNILFVRREDYLAHPRHTGKVESRLTNEPEVFAAVQSWAANHTACSLNVVNGLFAHMTMREQVQAIYEASVVIGAHGAGLTHLVSARSKAIVLEIISSRYQRPHFSLISEWKGLEYHAINLAGSYARPEMVVDELSSIVRSLGCVG